jgi:Vacuolar protein sorting-associated protein 26.
VYSYRMPPETNSPIKMDVGIEDCLHIEFEYSKSKYHLKDVIVGRIYFLLVRLKIKHMELSIIRRETTGSPPNQYNESETLVRFEVFVEPRPAPREAVLGAIIARAIIDNALDHGWIAFSRRNHSHPFVPWRIRPHTHIPRRQQEVFDTILPQPGAD